MHQDVTLHVRGLARRFGPRWVLKRVSVEVPSGTSLMLLGANGSGKTTLLRCLATALRPHEGGATLGGRDLWADRGELRERIVLYSHASALYEDLTARENLLVWARMGGHAVDVDALLERVGITTATHGDLANRPVRAFSAGMRRRVALARALLKKPWLALFDEPFTALDPDGRTMMADVIRELRASGCTLVLSTHLPHIAAPLCDTAIRLDGGAVTWRGHPSHAPALGSDAPASVGEA